MWSCLILLVAPSIARASITINVKAGGSASEASVEARGVIREIIPDDEREAWTLNDGQLKSAAEAFSSGYPTDAFLKSPTPWNDLYVTYGWPEVYRTLEVTGARIISATHEPGIVVVEEIINNSSIGLQFAARVSQEIQETVTRTWSKGNELQIGQEITYGVNFLVAGANGSTSLSYTANWGTETILSKIETVGIELSSTIQVPPKHGASAALTMSRGSMEIQIDYKASLSGSAACNYRRKHNGHHFWAYGINGLLKAAKSPTTILSRETLRIGFYSNVRIVITDTTTSQVLYSAPVNIIGK